MKRGFDTKNMSKVAFFNILGPIILNGINFFTVPIFTRILGATNYGIFSLYMSYVSIMTIIVSLQSQGSIAPSSIHYKDENEQKKYLSSILTLSLYNFFIILIFSLIFIEPISNLIGMNKIIVIFILLQSFFGCCCNIAITYFTFKKYSYKSFIISLTNSILNIIISLLILNSIDNYNILYFSRVLGSAIPNIIVGFILMMVIFVKGKVFFSKKYWKFCLSICLPLVFHGLSSIVLSQSDRIMLKEITGSEALIGVYSLAYSLSNILNVIWAALNNTWIPFYYDYITNNELDLIKEKSENYLQLFTILTIGFILLSPEIIMISSSMEFWGAMELIPILVVSIFMIFLYSFPANFEFYNKKTGNIAIGTILAAICNIILNYLLIPKYNMYGAAIATLISYILLFIFHQLICMKIIKNNYHYKWSLFIPYCLKILLGCILFYLTIDYWIIRWFIGGLLGIYLVYKIVKRRSVF